jgi:hypothetical protein
MPWWLRHYLRELPAVAAVAGIVGVVILVLALIYLPTDHDGEFVQGEIVGFHGFLEKGRRDNVVLASVRLQEGRIQNVEIPALSAASRCHVSDRLVMVRRGRRLMVDRSACGRP